MMDRPSEHDQLARLGRALRTLSGSNRALLRAREEPALLQEICRVVIEEAGYLLALVGRAEHDDARSITVLAARQAGKDAAAIPPLTWGPDEQGQGATGRAVRSGEPCLIRDTQADEMPGYWREVNRRLGTGSVLSLPLKVGDTIFGALTIAAPEPDAFGEPERHVLLEAADDLAFGIATLRERRRREQAELEIVRLNRALRARASVSRALIGATDEHGLLGDFCRVAVDDCGYRMAWVGYLRSDPQRSVEPMAYAGFEDGFLEAPRRWDGNDRLRRTYGQLQLGQPVVARNLTADPEYPFREQAAERGYASVAVLPLRVEGALIGSLHILAAEADAFEPSELELLAAAATDLAFGIGALRARERAAAAEAAVRQMTHFDPVTALPNRVRFRELLVQAIEAARVDRRPLALLRIGLERFREINETLGDDEVDRLLREVAQRLQRAVADAGAVARLAEGEFAVLQPRAGAEQARQLAQRILAALHEPIETSGLLLDARSCIGISLFPGHGREAEALLRRGTIALDQAHAAGSPVMLFHGALDRECEQRLALMSDLRGAIDRDELQMYCQPKLAISSGMLCGAEALVRWHHPRRGLVNPGEFIKLAESTGLITPLTYWMLDAALRHSYSWHEHGLRQPLSVNLSARDLRDPKLIERVAGSLATWGAEPGWIEFELTESALMVDPAGALETLTRLKALDVQLAIDDYGTGYSSLAYLQRLPVDAIKIDQSFVGEMTRSRDSAAIVRSTIELAHNLDLKVVAEGVEDQATFDSLAALGCDMAQGYCIGRPIPAEQFPGWRAGPMRH